MTPRQPTQSAKPRPRRANSEGTNAHQRADGRYHIAVRYIDADGLPQRKSIYGQDGAECRANAEEFRSRIAQGISVRRQQDTLQSTALEWVETTLAVDDEVGESTKDLYAGFVRRHIIGSELQIRLGSRTVPFGEVPMDKLMAKHIELWLLKLRKGKPLDQLSAKVQAQIQTLQDLGEEGDEEAAVILRRASKGLSDSTVRSIFGVLRSVLDMAVRDKMIGVNCALEVNRPKIKDQEEAVYLTPDEVKQFLLVAREGAGSYHTGRSRFALLFELLVNTGLRRGEGLALRWSDIDWERKTLRVRRTVRRHEGVLVIGAPKTEKSKRTIPLRPAAIRVLKQARARQREERMAAGPLWHANDYVFTTETGTLSEPRNALRALMSAGEQIGRPDIGVHSLRHTFATTLIVKNVPIKVVSELLGHASIAITGDLYGHVSPAVAHEAMAVLDEAFG